MNIETVIDFGELFTTIFAVIAALWAFRRWYMRDELFPAICLEVDVKFLGVKDEKVVCELLAKLENKGIVPIKIREFTFKVLGLGENDDLLQGDGSVRHQLLLGRQLISGTFIPQNWGWTFIYPGVSTEYNFITTVPIDIAFMRMQADFNYVETDRSHHAAKLFAVPKNLERFGQ